MTEAERSPVLVRGAGDVGSAVAAVLFRAGYAVALHDEPAPVAPRRGMAFADAVFDGAAASMALPLCASIHRPNCGTH
jgi:xanthine dehydrogenase accessory factor